MWNYYWGYTAAQIELAIADGPVIVYKHDKKGADGKKKKPTGANVERSMLRYEQRKREGKTRQMFDPKEFSISQAYKK